MLTSIFQLVDKMPPTDKEPDKKDYINCSYSRIVHICQALSTFSFDLAIDGIQQRILADFDYYHQQDLKRLKQLPRVDLDFKSTPNADLLKMYCFNGHMMVDLTDILALIKYLEVDREPDPSLLSKKSKSLDFKHTGFLSSAPQTVKDRIKYGLPLLQSADFLSLAVSLCQDGCPDHPLPHPHDGGLFLLDIHVSVVFSFAHLFCS
jgi:hypothetical protein